MKKILSIAAILFAFSTSSFAQKEKETENEGKEKISVPAAVKAALLKKYPEAKIVMWEKEKRNYEANWGGSSGEDHSVQFKPNGDFVEIVNAIAINELPAPVFIYVKMHYKGVKITEAGKVTDAAGKIFYEAEVKKKDILFDEKGNFIKAD